MYNNISSMKIRKLERDFIDGKICNSETGEVIDIFNEAREIDASFVEIKYKFSFFSKDMTDLYKELGATNYGHLNLLVNTIRSDNSVRYELLGLGVSGTNKLKGIFKKLGITKYEKGKYYLNPAISSYNRKVPARLVKLFEKENKEIYNIIL